MNTVLRLLLLFSFILISCHKDYLDIKSSKKMVVPKSLDDFQALLDNTLVFNYNTPQLGEISSDDYYVEDQHWASLSVPPQKNAYIWNSDVYEGYTEILDWNFSYERVFYSNIVLDGLKGISVSARDEDLLNNIKGSALFLRAWSFYQLAQIFCMPYDSETSKTDLGLPLRLVSDIEVKVDRSSVEETYNQILKDLKDAAELLPMETIIKTRPTKPAAYAMLAKTYLLLNDYENALKYANLCLDQYSTLIDYTLIDLETQFPFSKFNDEVIFHSSMQTAAILNQTRMKITPEILNFFKEGDLRKDAFFLKRDQAFTFKGSYNGEVSFFSGIATDEVYLIASECFARLNMLSDALSLLNYLLENRYSQKNFKPIGMGKQEDIIEQILLERRKELIFRGIRWSDIRRLNKNGSGILLEREIEKKRYFIEPNDPKYALPIPDMVMELSNIKQNIR